MLQSWMADGNLNIQEAATELGVNGSTVGRWLSGKGAPNVKRSDALGRQFGRPSAEVALAIISLSNPAARTEKLLEQVIARQEVIERKLAELEEAQRS